MEGAVSECIEIFKKEQERERQEFDRFCSVLVQMAQNKPDKELFTVPYTVDGTGLVALQRVFVTAPNPTIAGTQFSGRTLIGRKK